jgi:diguanylate cyclase (GGDEF)-like protein/PAS domain S-box-containing protein
MPIDEGAGPPRSRFFSRARRGHKDSEQRLKTIIDTALDAVITMDEAGIVTAWSPSAAKIFGWSESEILGQTLSLTIVPPRYRAAHEAGLARYRQNGEGPVLGTVIEITGLHRDGREFPVELAISPAWQSGEQTTFIAYVRDITARRKAQDMLDLQLAVTRILASARALDEVAAPCLQHIAQALQYQAANLWVIDPDANLLRHRCGWAERPAQHGDFIEQSARVTFRSGEGLPGRVWESATPATIADVLRDSNFPRLAAARNAGLHGAVAFPLGVGGVSAVIEFFTDAVRELEPDVVAVMSEIGSQIGQFVERSRAEEALHQSVERLAEMAATDPLTGLRNRREFERLLSCVPRQPFAVLAIDIDHLKAVNDEYGHEAGDTVLQAVALTLSSLVRGWDIVARIGGDEFAALLLGAPPGEVAAVAERMRIAMHGVSVPYGQARISVGWAPGGPGSDPLAVWRRADENLYSAKHHGRDRAEGGDTGAPASSTLFSGWTERVDEALRTQQLGVVFQPIVNLASGVVAGYEALARPSGIGPSDSVEEFFRAAHRIGRIRDIDWLCRRCAVQQAPWHLPEWDLFINISAALLLDPLHDVDQLLLVLRSAGAPPERIVLEIAEREIVSDFARLRLVLSAYREHGVRFALDDVGEGHSTLELLAAASPEYLKIARSLTTTASRSGSRAAIRAAVAFAGSSGGIVIAEGVENRFALEAMREHGVPLGQGFLLGRPITATEVRLRPSTLMEEAARSSGADADHLPVDRIPIGKVAVRGEQRGASALPPTP